MAEFDALLGRGFSFLLGKTAAPTVTAQNGSTAQVISSPLIFSKDLKEAGLMPQWQGTVELTNADFVRLAIADRSTLTYKSADGATVAVLRVTTIENDPSDPCVKLGLKIEQGGKAG